MTRRRVLEVVDAHGGPDAARLRPDTVVTEEPLEIRLAWPGQEAHRVAVTMRTPGADFELATGFLVAEGVLPAGHLPRNVGYCMDRELRPEERFNVVVVTLAEPPLRVPGRRATTMSSACGVCGTESLDEVFRPGDAPLVVQPLHHSSLLTDLAGRLRGSQPLFDKTGSIHAAGVFDRAGTLVGVREDVGRHNAVDKVVGARQLGTLDFDETALLCVSGRVGFDIVTKAVTGRIGTVIAVGGASSLALDLAERAGITICGFTRGSRTVVYTHHERIRVD